MTSTVRDREYWPIAKAVLRDAVARGLLLPSGKAERCGISTILLGDIPAAVAVTSFFRPPPSGDLPPEAYLNWTLWPDEPGLRPNGHFNVAFRLGRGWHFYGDHDYRRAVSRGAALRRIYE